MTGPSSESVTAVKDAISIHPFCGVISAICAGLAQTLNEIHGRVVLPACPAE
ncbi:MAG: hypothetical protein JSV53_00795 [candidate division WOR-3 bacterium]|nr:MAG: hypothetical protein JSV53_00795 [candidate division WOR-3 bacterium]